MFNACCCWGVRNYEKVGVEVDGKPLQEVERDPVETEILNRLSNTKTLWNTVLCGNKLPRDLTDEELDDVIEYSMRRIELQMEKYNACKSRLSSLNQGEKYVQSISDDDENLLTAAENFNLQLKQTRETLITDLEEMKEILDPQLNAAKELKEERQRRNEAEPCASQE